MTNNRFIDIERAQRGTDNTAALTTIHTFRDQVWPRLVPGEPLVDRRRPDGLARLGHGPLMGLVGQVLAEAQSRAAQAPEIAAELLALLGDTITEVKILDLARQGADLTLLIPAAERDPAPAAAND